MERKRQEVEDTASLENPVTPVVITTTDPPVTGMSLHSDDGEAWLCAVTKREPSREDFMIDAGAATSVCQQSLADSLEAKPRRAGVEVRSATRHQFSTTGNTTICLRIRDGINMAGDFQIAPKDSGLLRSIIEVGQVCDRGNIITFRSTGGTTLSSLATALTLNVLVECIG